jgi:murein DD-endopeptidase MepM/ murein hydrolase activator NlpD
MLTGGTLSGNSIRLTIADGTYFFYAHLDGFAAGLTAGQTVRAGQIIGYLGSTGATSNHLHFEVHPKGGAPINPYPIVKAVDACHVTELLPQP